MSNAQHTPGPWKINKTGSENFIGISADGHYSLADVWMIDDGVTREQMEANARLIAASPELLEALKTMVDAIRKYGCGFESGSGEFWLGEEKARAAIAKATGG